jgi:hypothetical protein
VDVECLSAHFPNYQPRESSMHWKKKKRAPQRTGHRKLAEGQSISVAVGHLVGKFLELRHGVFLGGVNSTMERKLAL